MQLLRVTLFSSKDVSEHARGETGMDDIVVIGVRGHEGEGKGRGRDTGYVSKAGKGRVSESVISPLTHVPRVFFLLFPVRHD